MEDAITKAATFTKQIIQRKAENNVINLDRKKLKEGTFQQFNTSNVVCFVLYNVYRDFLFSLRNSGLMTCPRKSRFKHWPKRFRSFTRNAKKSVWSCCTSPKSQYKEQFGSF